MVRGTYRLHFGQCMTNKNIIYDIVTKIIYLQCFNFP